VSLVVFTVLSLLLTILHQVIQSRRGVETISLTTFVFLIIVTVASAVF